MVLLSQSLLALISFGLTCIIHANLTQHQLKRIFGSYYDDYINNYVVNDLRKIDQNDGSFMISIPYKENNYLFVINRLHRLFSDEFHAVYKETDGSRLETSLNSQKCIYNGNSISHKNVQIALVGCGNDMHGMMTLDDGEFLFINPAPRGLIPSTDSNSYSSNMDSSRPHIVHKRSSTQFTPFNKSSTDKLQTKVTCLFDAKSAKKSLSNKTQSNERLTVVNGPLTIEIGLFVDDQLWDHFKQIYGSEADHELENFVIATVNNINLLYNHHSISPKTNLKIVRYEVLKSSPPSLIPNLHRNGDVDLLLDAFCLYQQNLNPNSDSDPKHWDHALLFTGYDLFRGSVTSVAGYAPVKGMCSGIRSCTINEGMDFGSIFVITHEMGHSLGMYHDGDNGCELNCCIMSPSLGTGKTHWSQCSNREFNTFFNDLGSALELPPQCLLDGADDPVPLDFTNEGILPGQRYNLDQQCRIFHGDCWHHELRESQIVEDVCEMVWCGENEGLIRTAHPALEGTSCGINKWCIQGKCEQFGRIKPFLVHGSWASWNDFPKKDCGGQCSSCQIEGQLSVRRSIRLCEKPAPNFGGENCKGSPYRAMLCNQERCQSNVNPDQYALDKCNSLRAKDGKSSTTSDMVLSGSGFQYVESPCKVWCQVAFSGFIRAVNSFPDGTPCGANRFCVKGECLSLSCDGKALVANVNDCPHGTTVSDSGPAAEPWSTWSFWSPCTKSCGLGLQARSRDCRQSSCIGPSVQSVPCNVHPCPNNAPWGEWSGWSACSTTCGKGLQNRQRMCKGNICYGTSIETKDCTFNQLCYQRSPKSVDGAGFWGDWSTWSQCSVTCGVGVQTKERKCNTGGVSDCFGENVVSSPCSIINECDTNSSNWSLWTKWSQCTVTCDGGQQRRSRKCLDSSNSSNCQGTSNSVQSCNTQTCTPSQNGGKWGEWEEWETCTTKSKTRKRFRTCMVGVPCLQGEWSESSACP